MALRSHRPRSPLRDPKRPAHARWRLGEPALHLLTGASRLRAHAKPRSCTRTSTQHQLERTNCTTLCTLPGCTRAHVGSGSSSVAAAAAAATAAATTTATTATAAAAAHTARLTSTHHINTHAQHIAHCRHDCERAWVGTTAEGWQQQQQQRQRRRQQRRQQRQPQQQQQQLSMGCQLNGSVIRSASYGLLGLPASRLS